MNHNKLKDTNMKYVIESSYFTALASILAIVESLIPKPLPFIRIGFANVILLLLVTNRKYLTALIVLFAKTIIGGVVVGTLLLPTTIISLGAGLTSLTVMYLVSKYNNGFTLLGISILGAVSHNIMQLFIVRNILIFSDSLFNLVPIMILLAILTGSVTGVIVTLINNNFKEVLNEKVFA